MVNSMTGYGKGEAEVDGCTVVAEIRTVNHRFIEFSIRLPYLLNGYEKEVERIIRSKVKRGHVYVTVTLEKSADTEHLGINKEFLSRAYRELKEFAASEGIPGKIEINTLLSLSEAFTNDVDIVPRSRLWLPVRKALGAALRSCVEMRRNEGAELLNDIASRIAAAEKITDNIGKRAPMALKKSITRARKRVKQVLGGSFMDESRWSVEAAIIADRADFSEELVRLRSHLRQLRSIVRKGGEISKKMTFLLQEIHRESTTMGNKAVDSTVIRYCLSIKEEVEKIREQVQNLE